MNLRHELVALYKNTLERSEPGSILPVDETTIEDALPHFWREDAKTPEEWFIKFCRAFGLHATHDPMSRRYRVRLTLDAEH